METWEIEHPEGSTSKGATSMQNERLRHPDAAMRGVQANGLKTAAQRSKGGGVPSPFTPGFNSMERPKRPTRRPGGIEQTVADERQQQESRFGPSPAAKFYSNPKPKPARADISTSRAALLPRPGMLEPGVGRKEIDWRRPGPSTSRTRVDSSPLSPVPASDAGSCKPRRGAARSQPHFIDVAESDEDDDEGVNAPHIPEPSSLRGRSAASSSTRSVSPQKRSSHSPTKPGRGGRQAPSGGPRSLRRDDREVSGDPIQDPDEDDNEFQIIGVSESGRNGGKGKGRAAPLPRKEGLRAASSRSRSPVKAPAGSTPEAGRGSATIRSSALGPKLKDALGAGVESAALGSDRLGVHSIVFDGSYFMLYGEDDRPFRIPRDAMEGLRICANPKHPLVFCQLSVNAENLDRRSLSLLAGKPYPKSTVEPKTLLIFLTEDAASGKFMANIVKDWQAKSQPCGTITDENTCYAIQQSLPSFPAESDGAPINNPSSEPRRNAAIAAEQRRTAEPNKKDTSRLKRSDGNLDSAKEASTSRKGKGKGKEDPTQPKLLFPTLEPQRRTISAFPMPPPSASPAEPHVRRSTRHSGAASLNYAEPDENADPEVVVSAPPAKNLPPPPVDRNALLFPWPLQGRADLHITAGDLYRITSGDFLNDTLLEFGLRHVLSELVSQAKVGPDEVHMFNSFFYNKLSKKTKSRKIGDPDWPAYDSVKKWTKNKDMFAKKFIVVPINENMHWYLAVIFNPAGILRRTATPPPAPAAHRPVTRAQGTDGEEPEAVEEVEDRPPAFRRGDLADSELDELEELDEAVGDAVPQRSEADADADLDGDISMGEPNRAADESIDELALDDQSNDHAFIVRRQGKEGSVESAGMVAVRNDIRQLSIESSPEKSKPIQSSTLSFFQDQFQQPETAPAAAVESPPQPAKKGRPLLPDVEVLGSEGCWIMTFDSLGGSHKAVHTCLNEWLKFEAKHKRDVQYEMTDATYWEARVPSQPNFSDCGLFLIHYARQLLERPDEMLAFIQRRPPPTSTPENRSWSEDRDRLWRLEETRDLRHLWATIIDSLQLQSDLIRQGRNASEAEAEAAKAMESRQAAQSAAPHVSEHADPLNTSQSSVVELSQPPTLAGQPPIEGASREARKSPVDAEEAEEAEEAVETLEVVEQGEGLDQSSLDFAGGLVGHDATLTPNGTKSHSEEHIDPSLYGPGVPLVTPSKIDPSLYGPGVPLVTPSKIDPRLSSPGVVGHTRSGRRLDTRTWSSSEEEEPIEEGGMATLYSQLPAGAGLPADGFSHHDERRLFDKRDHQPGPSDESSRWKVLSAADSDTDGPIDQIGDARPDQLSGGHEDVFMGSGPDFVGPSHRSGATHETIVPERNAEMDRDLLDDESEQVDESQHPSESGDTQGGAMGSRTQQGRVESEASQEGGKQPRHSSDKGRRQRSPIPGPYLTDRPEQDDQLNSVASTRDGSRSTSPNTTTTSDSKLSFKQAGFRSPRTDHTVPHEHSPRPKSPPFTINPLSRLGDLISRRAKDVESAAAFQSVDVPEAAMEDIITATPRASRDAFAVSPTGRAAGSVDNSRKGVGVVDTKDTSVSGTSGSDLLKEQELARDHVEPRPLRPSFDVVNLEDDTLSGKTSPAMSEDDDVPVYPMGNPRGPTQTTFDRDALDRQPAASSPPLSSSFKRDKVIPYPGRSKDKLYARKTTGNVQPSAKGAKRLGEEQGTPATKAKRPRSGKSGAESEGAATGRPRKGKGRGGTGAQSADIRTPGGGERDPIEIPSTDDEVEKQNGGAGAGAGDGEDEDVEK